MAGHISVKMLKSHMSSETDTLSSERWNVEKERIRLDSELANFYDHQVARCKSIRDSSNSSACDVYEKLLYTMRWAIPSLTISFRDIIIGYCEHLLGTDPSIEFKNISMMKAWIARSRGTKSEKVMLEIDRLCSKMKKLIARRDQGIVTTKSILVKKAEKMVVKNEGKLRWMMEVNVGRKDRYWTIWFLTSRGMIVELKRLIQSADFNDINERDPDFGYTALHCACKRTDLAVVKLLIEKGADIHAKVIVDQIRNRNLSSIKSSCSH